MRIQWHQLRGIQDNALTLQELLEMGKERQTENQRSRFVSGSSPAYLGESIALYDVVLDPKHFQVNGKVEVFPPVMLSLLILWHTLALEPLPLWYPRILHHRLINAHSVIL